MKNLVEVDREILPSVLKVLNLVTDTKKKKRKRKSKSFNDIYSASTSIPKYKRVITQCIDLLINCIASHRYQEAVNVLWILIQDKCINIPYHFRAIMIVLFNVEFNRKHESVWSCIRALQDFMKMNKKEVLLEYMMYALKSNMHDIQRFDAEMRKKGGLKKYDKIESIFGAYVTMIEYIERSKNYCGDSLPSQSQSTMQNFQLIFEKLIKEPGNWDIFVLTMIKILHCDNEVDEIKLQIEELLLLYINNNPDNINAYIYLCTYLYHYYPESTNLEKYLKIIAKMNPSDIRILWLLQIWTGQKTELASRLKYTFMFLDYPSNKENVTAWKILKQSLSEVTFIEDKQNVIQTLWITRCRSWEWMHFNTNSNLETVLNDRELVLQKVDILSFFFKKHKFIEKAQKLFPDIKDDVPFQ